MSTDTAETIDVPNEIKKAIWILLPSMYEGDLRALKPYLAVLLDDFNYDPERHAHAGSRLEAIKVLFASLSSQKRKQSYDELYGLVRERYTK